MSRAPNHWVSGLGPFDRCGACGQAVPNASERGPCIITGQCRGIEYVSREVLVVCVGCARKPPYFGVEIEVPSERILHPGWCMICHAWIGDAWHVVPRRAPVVDLVTSLLGPLAG